MSRSICWRWAGAASGLIRACEYRNDLPDAISSLTATPNRGTLLLEETFVCTATASGLHDSNGEKIIAGPVVSRGVLLIE